MPTIRWSVDARRELLQILDFVGEHSEPAASRLLKKIGETVQLLSKSPKIARPGRVDGTREKLITGTPYVIAFEEIGLAEGGPGIAVLHIIHTSREWKKGSWPKPEARYPRPR